ncbi:MAG: hypothetical protein HRT61_09465 [Ekhidna sp.]|nr:hypothetical protein [Ekhidna sp.]
MIRKIHIVLLATLFIACSEKVPDAQAIVDQAIQASGTENLEKASARFVFRSVTYSYQMNEGSYKYSRLQTDSLQNEIKDILNNEGLTRYINDTVVALEQKKKEAYTASVNSVIYFAFLPFSLNDGAVIKEYVGKSKIRNQEYHKIKVTFNAEGGGEDFEDVFYYWFDVNDFSMDFLAYSYNEDEGKGVRFREALNSRKVNNVVIQDYNNYKPINEDGFDLSTIDEAFNDGKLNLLSVIALEDVEIMY